MARTLALLWDNFGPLHQDRVRAVAQAFGAERRVVGLELGSMSDTYGWEGFDDCGFEKLTLFPDKDLSEMSTWSLLRKLVAASNKLGRGDYILCHWNVKAIFLFAIWLRMTGSKVYTMGCSKFDDKPRSAMREALKSLMFLPYSGGIASGRRSIDYFRFLGIPAVRLVGEYNTVSIDRIRRLSGQAPAPAGTPYAERAFLSVARLVPKKNLGMLLEAYALYLRDTTTPPRPLIICGSGPEESGLKAQAGALGVDEQVTFTGFVQTGVVAEHLGRALALLLPSAEEQFGNVVPEAQAVGLPVILSDNAGARDLLVRSAVNGFVIEPDNPAGLAFFMRVLAEDEALWTRMTHAATAAAAGGDTAEFCRAIQTLTCVPTVLPERPDLPPAPAKQTETHHAAG